MHFAHSSRLTQDAFNKKFQELQSRLAQNMGRPVQGFRDIDEGPTVTRVERQQSSNGNVIVRTFVNNKLVDTKEENHTPSYVTRSFGQPKGITIQQREVPSVKLGSDFANLNTKVQSKRTMTETGPDGRTVTKTYINGQLAEVKEEGPTRPTNTHTLFTESSSPSYFESKQPVVTHLQPTRLTPNKITLSQDSTGPSDDFFRQTAALIMDHLAAYRNGLGAPAVTSAPELYPLAVAHSQDMALKDTLSHEGFPKRVDDALKYRSMRSLENVGFVMNSALKTPKDFAKAFIDNWASSPPHKKNMLDKQVTRANVGVARNGSNYYATMILTRPQ